MDPSSGQKNQDFFFYVDMEEEFLFLLYKDLGCRLDKFPFLHLLQTCAHSVLLGSSRFPMLSVDAACAFAFSLGREGLNIRPPRVALPSAVFTCLLVCVLYSDNCRGYASLKGASELTPCGLMIAWASGWRASKLCMWPCRNRSWRLPLRALRHRMWDSPNMLTI